MRFLKLITLSVIVFLQSWAYADTQYVLQPSGPFGVGYQDFWWVNQAVCPDFFYNGSNQVDYSKTNTHFCREIMARVYYPASTSGISSPYYPALIAQLQAELPQAGIPEITPAMIQALSNITTFTYENAPIIPNQTFPVVIFNPGLMSPVEAYVNVISDLASHGYIVVAVNNTFIGDPIQFPDGRIVNTSTTTTEQEFEEAPATDITYAYQQILNNPMHSPIFAAMNTQEIGMLGHSLGAVMTVITAHTHPEWIKAAVAMEATYDPPNYSPLSGFSIPFMHMHGSYWRAMYPDAAKAGPFQLTKNEYYVVMAPAGAPPTYTEHNNFGDTSTLQYQPALQIFNEKTPVTPPLTNQLEVGTAPGFQTDRLINQYIVQFFDYFLKGEQDNRNVATFKDCVPISMNSQLICGLGATNS